MSSKRQINDTARYISDHITIKKHPVYKQSKLDSPLTIEALDYPSHSYNHTLLTTRDRSTQEIKSLRTQSLLTEVRSPPKQLDTRHNPENFDLISPPQSSKANARAMLRKPPTLETEYLEREQRDTVNINESTMRPSYPNTPLNQQLEFQNRSALTSPTYNESTHSINIHNYSSKNTSSLAYTAAMKALQEKNRKNEEKVIQLEKDKIQLEHQILREAEKVRQHAEEDANKIRQEVFSLRGQLEIAERGKSFIEGENRTLIGKMDSLETEKQKLFKEIDQLKVDKSKLLDEFEQLKRKSDDNSNLTVKLALKEKELKDMSTEKEGLNLKVNYLIEQIKKMEKDQNEYKKLMAGQFQEYALKNEGLLGENTQIRQYFSQQILDFKKELDLINAEHQKKQEDSAKIISELEKRNSNLDEILLIKKQEADSARKKLDEYMNLTSRNDQVNYQNYQQPSQRTNRESDAYMSKFSSNLPSPIYNQNGQIIQYTDRNDYSSTRPLKSERNGQIYSDGDFRAFSGDNRGNLTQRNNSVIKPQKIDFRNENYSPEPNHLFSENSDLERLLSMPHANSPVNKEMNRDLESYVNFQDKGIQLREVPRKDSSPRLKEGKKEQTISRNLSFGKPDFVKVSESNGQITERGDFSSGQSSARETGRLERHGSMPKIGLKSREYEKMEKQYQELCRKVTETSDSKERAKMRGQLIELTGEMTRLSARRSEGELLSYREQGGKSGDYN